MAQITLRPVKYTQPVLQDLGNSPHGRCCQRWALREHSMQPAPSVGKYLRLGAREVRVENLGRHPPKSSAKFGFLRIFCSIADF